MKKTFILALLSCSMLCSAETKLTSSYYANVNGGGIYGVTVNGKSNDDLLGVSEFGYFWHLQGSETRPAGSGNAWAGVPQTAGTVWSDSGSVYSALTSSANTDYSITLNDGHNYTISEAIYVQDFDGNGSAGINLSFTEGASITAAGHFNVTSARKMSLTLSESMASVLAEGSDSIYEHTLISAGVFWNADRAAAADAITFNVQGLDDTVFTNRGVIFFDTNTGTYYSEATLIVTGDSSHLTFSGETQLAEREYALVVSGVNNGGISKISFQAHTPEPATATLSLLALAGLAARRRRH